MNKIINQTRRRAQASNRLAYDATLVTGKLSDALNKLADTMAENDAIKERCAMQNIKASRSLLLIKTIGNA